MSKLKEHLLEISFILLMLKSLATEVTISTSILLITLVISIVYTKYYLVQKDKKHSDALLEKVDALEKKTNSMALAMGMKRQVNG